MTRYASGISFSKFECLDIRITNKALYAVEARIVRANNKFSSSYGKYPPIFVSDVTKPFFPLGSRTIILSSTVPLAVTIAIQCQWEYRGA